MNIFESVAVVSVVRRPCVINDNIVGSISILLSRLKKADIKPHQPTAVELRGRRSFWPNTFLLHCTQNGCSPPSEWSFFSKPYQSCFLAAMWAVRCICKRNDVPRSFGRSISTACVLNQETLAEYPPILSVKPEAKTLRTELNHHLKIRNLNTVEEKTIGINMPRLNSFFHALFTP